jgi:hypothetical protein
MRATCLTIFSGLLGCVGHGCGAPPAPDDPAGFFVRPAGFTTNVDHFTVLHYPEHHVGVIDRLNEITDVLDATGEKVSVKREIIYHSIELGEVHPDPWAATDRIVFTEFPEPGWYALRIPQATDIVTSETSGVVTSESNWLVYFLVNASAPGVRSVEVCGHDDAEHRGTLLVKVLYSELVHLSDDVSRVIRVLDDGGVEVDCVAAEVDLFDDDGQWTGRGPSLLGSQFLMYCSADDVAAIEVVDAPVSETGQAAEFPKVGQPLPITSRTSPRAPVCEAWMASVPWDVHEDGALDLTGLRTRDDPQSAVPGGCTSIGSSGGPLTAANSQSNRNKFSKVVGDLEYWPFL